jgi:ferric-dicitrate binding protein FerR (iron transport regulator)
MAKMLRLNSEQRDNLVAYLDGELSEEETQEIEQILAASEVARHEVDMLSRSWDLIGVLPTAKASEEFTRKTLSSIRAAEAERSFISPQTRRNMRRVAVLACGTAVLGLCMYLGFTATNRWVPNEADQLLDEYEVISNLDRYSEVGSIEFLQALKNNRTLEPNQ